MSIRFSAGKVSVACAIAASILCSTIVQARKPPRPGDDGGGPTNPALVYVVDDAIVTIASADGASTLGLTGGSKGGRVRRSAPVWSPDGTQIAFLEQADARNAADVFDLYVTSANGSQVAFVRRFNGGVNSIDGYNGIQWLPGGFIHFTGATGPAVLDLFDGSIQSLNLDLIHDWIGPSSIAVDPTVPRSAGLIAYSALDHDGATDESDIHLAIVTIAADGTLLVDPATIVCLDRTGQQGFPAISPDGWQVAFYDDASLDGGNTLAVVDINDSDGIGFGSVHSLLQGGLGEFRVRPCWSPDSNWIAFTWAPDGGPFEIARIRPDGTDFVNVTRSQRHEVYPNWRFTWDPSGP